jgi:hypothetical protein
MSAMGVRAAVYTAAMPLEQGHWQRTNTPLRRLTRRERNVVVGGLAATVVAVLAIVVGGSAGDSHPGPAPGCVRALVAGPTGGEMVNACGTKARALCAHTATFEGPRAEAILASCRADGIRFAPASTKPGGQG